jgi:hypothetical protein
MAAHCSNADTKRYKGDVAAAAPHVGGAGSAAARLFTRKHVAAGTHVFVTDGAAYGRYDASHQKFRRQ